MTGSRCSNCKAPLAGDDLFCGECGQPVRSQPPAPSFSPPPPAPQSSPPPFPPPPASTPSPPTALPTFSSGAPPPPPPAPRAYSSVPPPPPTFQEGAPPKKKRSGCLIAGIVIVALVACLALACWGAMAQFPDLIPTDLDSIFGTATPSLPGGPSSGGDAAVVVENYLDISVCFLYISPSSAGDWGDDWLGANETIDSGSSRTFWIASGQTVDLRTEDCEGVGIDEQYSVYVPAEGITYTLGP